MNTLWLLINRLIISPLFLFYSRFSRGMTLGVRAIIINDKQEVFLIKHSYAPSWGLPGGGVEIGQTFAEALKTELQEEGNIELSGEPQLFQIYLNSRTNQRDYVALYVVREFTQSSLPKPNLEIIDHRWFQLTALPQDIMRGAKARIDEVIYGADKEEIW